MDLKEQQKQVHCLKLPQFHLQNVRNILYSKISERKGGIRLEHEIINGKHFFHNYGHGGAGVSLAYGSAFISSKSLTVFMDINSHIECGVIGAGISGLMTAVQLARRNHKVTIYAQQIPNAATRSNSIASQISPCAWMPSRYPWNDNLLQHELLSKLSYQYLKESLALKRSRALRSVNVYSRKSNVEDLKEIVNDFIMDTFNSVYVDYGTGQLEEVVYYKTIAIDTAVLLEELRIEAILRGVQIVQRKFNSVTQILALQENAIFNCMGVNAGRFFDSTDVAQPLTGYVIEFDEKQSHLQPYVITVEGKKEGMNFELQCFEKKTFLIGYTKGDSAPKIDQKFLESVISSAQADLRSSSKFSAKL